MNIQDYCDILNIELVLRYYPNQESRWCARFPDCEVKEGIFLVSSSGNAKTPEGAIENYLSAIRGETIVFHATSAELRREYVVPNSLGIK
jgi:hypothetical protein